MNTQHVFSLLKAALVSAFSTRMLLGYRYLPAALALLFYLMLGSSNVFGQRAAVSYAFEIYEFISVDCPDTPTLFDLDPLEEYSAKFTYRDNTQSEDEAKHSECYTVNDTNGGNLLLQGDITKRSQAATNQAKYFAIGMDSWEDDGGNRCTFDDGDDCRTNNTYSHYFRVFSPSQVGINHYSSMGSHLAIFRLAYAWRYTALSTADKLTPRCDGEYTRTTTTTELGHIPSWQVYLEAGSTYEFETTAGGDTYLRLYGYDGFTVVASDDNSGYLGNGLSKLGYAVSTTGTYFLEISKVYTTSNRGVLTEPVELQYLRKGNYFNGNFTVSPSDPDVCAGEQLTLTTTTGITNLPFKRYEYRNWESSLGSWGGWQQASNSNPATWTPLAPKVQIRAVQLDGSCERYSLAKEIYVFQPPVVSISGPDVSCPGEEVVLTASVSVVPSPTTIQWQATSTPENDMTWVNIPGAVNLTYTTTDVQYYRVRLYSEGCQAVYSNTHVVNVKPGALADITYTAEISEVTSTYGSCSDPFDAEEYTALVYFRGNDQSFDHRSQCKTCNSNNSDCTYAENTYLGTFTDNSSYFITRIDAWEDDGGNRCIFDSGDDCRSSAGSAIIFFRRDALPSSGAFSTSPYFGGTHKWRIRYMWSYSGQASPITPTCVSQTSTLEACEIRSHSVHLTAGEGYSFETTSGPDTYLRLYAPNGSSLVAEDDNGGAGSLSKIVYTSTSTGWYYLECSNASRGVLDQDATLAYHKILAKISCPANVLVNNDPGQCTAMVTVTETTTSDDCVIASVVNDYTGTADASGTYPVGATTVTWTATDSYGNIKTCTQQITVVDNEDPTITCPADIEQGADAGECQALVTITPATATDNCSVAAPVGVRSDAAALSDPYPVGETLITWTATDAAGNTSRCVQTVTVTDDEDPAITCAADQSQTADAGECQAAVTITAATATDNCYAAAPVGARSDLAALSDPYPLGETLITWTATDVAGNTSMCVQTVTVTDDEDPAITCAADQSQTADAGECQAAVTITAATATDNCSVADPVSVRSDAAALSDPYPAGQTLITWTATDVAGNTSTCEQTVTVTDDEAPAAACQDVTVQLDADGNGSTSAALVDAGSSDNCGLAPTDALVLDNSVFTCADLGSANTVTLTVTDDNGNSSICTATVTVITIDTDGDGVLDCDDNCPTTANANQADSDKDGIGNVCDDCNNNAGGTCDDGNPCTEDVLDANCNCINVELDTDGDGLLDCVDPCPLSVDNTDTDGDGLADCVDPCPDSADNTDTDGDGVPDACDQCPGSNDAIDSDGDGVPNDCDLCAGSPDQDDSDGDGVPDGCDKCATGDDNIDLNNNDVPDACDACLDLIADAGDCRAIYLGYDPTACTNLTAAGAGGIAPYDYVWSTGEISATITVCPAATTTYTVTVTDAEGCGAADAVVVEVIKVSCGNNKVEICLNGLTSCVRKNEVQGNLDNGATLGACGITPCANSSLAGSPIQSRVEVRGGDFTLYPNPTRFDITVGLEAFIGQAVTLTIYNHLGQVASVISIGEVHMPTQRIVLDQLDSGAYLLQVRSQEQVRVKKFILMD